MKMKAEWKALCVISSLPIEFLIVFANLTYRSQSVSSDVHWIASLHANPVSMDVAAEEDDDDNMEEIDPDNIVGSRTRGKSIDFAKANQADDLPDSDDEDDDFEEEEENEDAMQE